MKCLKQLFLLILFVLVVLAIGCGYVPQCCIRLLPDYGRWKYNVGWESITIPFPNAVVNLHYLSREKLFEEVYNGYAIINGHLVGLKRHKEYFLACAPWENLAKVKQSKNLDRTICNIHLKSRDKVIGFFRHGERIIEIFPNMLTTLEDINIIDTHSLNETPVISFHNTLFRIDFQVRTLRLNYMKSHIPYKSVKFPLRGILCSLATQKDRRGKEFLFAILKQDAWGEERYALILFDDVFDCLGFYIFSTQISGIPYFVKNSQGNLFIVPLGAILSQSDGIFQMLAM